MHRCCRLTTNSEFVGANQLPLVIEFTDETAPKIFGGEIKSHLLLFVKKTADDFESLKSTLGEVAADFKGKILYIYIDVDVEDNMRFVT